MAITVDGQAYTLTGFQLLRDVPSLNMTAIQKSIIVTPTSTTFSMEAGSMNVNITYLSPIEVHSAIVRYDEAH